MEFKRSTRVAVGYLDKHEIDALLAAPDRTTKAGHRDHVLLLFLYNSGARADEAAQLEIGDMTLCGTWQRHSVVGASERQRE